MVWIVHADLGARTGGGVGNDAHLGITFVGVACFFLFDVAVLAGLL